MQFDVAKLAKEFGLSVDQVTPVLADLGIEVAKSKFDTDDETYELVKLELADLAPAAPAGDAVVFQPGRTPRDIAAALGVADKDVLTTLIKKFKQMKTLTTVLDDDLTEKLVAEYGKKVQWGAAEVPKTKPAATSTPKQGAVKRPPVVTIMGHVDHGKTSLLDYIRKSNVVKGEFGGITQHIGAYQVSLPEGVITFLDTPGHAAFTAMRARGAQVTDIAILVVAADDGIMPQTIEAISHAKNAGVPIIVAVNKIDKPEANPDRILQQLTGHDLIPEAYGGATITCNVSAVTGEGVPHLLEMILLQADIMELKADPRAEFEGVVIEAKLERGRGPVATVLVEQGTLHVGDTVLVGHTYGRLRAMTDWAGNKVKEAPPSTPVEILGLDEVPGAGEKVEWAKDEKSAREVAETRSEDARVKAYMPQKKRVTLRDIRNHATEGDIKDLNLIIKADVQGSLEAVRGLIDKLKHPEVHVKIIQGGVGPITEGDILLATATGAIVVGFNVKPDNRAKAEAERMKIEIRTYTIIYELIEDIEAALKGLLEPKFEEVHQGTVEIRAVFKLTKAGKVAGCHVTEGKILRNSKARVTRLKEVVFDGDIESLRNVKQDVREMTYGQDCGIRFTGWEDFKEGDVIEAYELVQVD